VTIVGGSDGRSRRHGGRRRGPRDRSAVPGDDRRHPQPT